MTHRRRNNVCMQLIGVDQVFEYVRAARDEWTQLPECPLRLAQ